MSDDDELDIHELLDVVDLVGLEVHEERARRIDDRGDCDASRSDIALGMRAEDRSLHFRFRMVLLDDYAEYVADYEAVYATEGAKIRVSESVLKDFASRVAFMAVYPYLRVSVSGSASRLGNPRPILGMVRNGEFTIADQMTPDDVDESFGASRSELA